VPADQAHDPDATPGQVRKAAMVVLGAVVVIAHGRTGSIDFLPPTWNILGTLGDWASIDHGQQTRNRVGAAERADTGSVGSRRG